MWKPGVAVTLTGTDTKQPLTTTVGLVKAIRFFQHWGNTNRIYLGDTNLAPAATPPTGIIIWLPAPAAGLIAADRITEDDAPNGINANQLFVAGTTGEIILWAYLEQ